MLYDGPQDTHPQLNLAQAREVNQIFQLNMRDRKVIETQGASMLTSYYKQRLHGRQVRSSGR